MLSAIISFSIVILRLMRCFLLMTASVVHMLITEYLLIIPVLLLDLYSFVFSFRIYYRGVPGSATNCSSGIWCHMSPVCYSTFGDTYSYNWSIGLAQWETFFIVFILFTHMIKYFIISRVDTVFLILPSFHVSYSSPVPYFFNQT